MDSETQAVLRAQTGDASAFRMIVEHHGPSLYRAALMMTRNPATAEDAVQETFLKGWRAIDSFRAGTKLQSWLTRILVNHLNGARRRRMLDVIRLMPGVAEPEERRTPENQFLRSETTKELFRLLDCLRRDERTVIVMNYYMEVSLAEVSDVTGWPAGTVRSRLSRALARLRGKLLADQSTSRRHIGRAGDDRV